MELKEDQKVWYIDHTWCELKEGIFVKNVPYSREYEDTVYVKGKYGTDQILKSWVFTSKSKGVAGLRKKIRRDISCKKAEIKHLESKL